MEFRTIVDIPHSKQEFALDEQFLFLGSCFSENIYERCISHGLSAQMNPFGVMYNPLSIAEILTILLSDKDTSIQEVHHEGVYHSLLHHSRFSHTDKEIFEDNIAQSILNGKKALQACNTLIITFGTAWVYEYDGKIVNNCHKLPEKSFIRRRLTVEEIVSAWYSILKHPALQHKRIIFTVSPIRHKRDGLHENNISKATLLLAIETLQQSKIPEIEIAYFPSYEIVLDELRDYRFYAEDMVHPSPVAIDYIWQRFSETYFSANTRQKMHLAHKNSLQAKHRNILS